MSIKLSSIGWGKLSLRLWQFGHLATMAIALALVLPAGVAAAPIYSLTHQSDSAGNTGPSDTIGPQGTPIDYSFNDFTYFQNNNIGTVQANVDQGSIGITASATSLGGPGQRQEVSASFQFDVIFGSAGASPIDVMMNMMIGGMVNPGTNTGSTVEVFAGIFPGLHTGDYTEFHGGTVNKSGMLSGFTDDGTSQLISTGLINVPVNTLVQMTLLLKTIQLYSFDTGTISFGNTLSLSTIGDVFTVVGSDSISVNSEDAGIINNRYGAAVVPVPAALPLFGTGLALLGFIGWRRKRKMEAA